jgi:hypothetical protein
MSNPKPFLEPSLVEARLKSLERQVKALSTATSGIPIPIPLQPWSQAGILQTDGTGATVTSATFGPTHLARQMSVPYDAIVAFVGVIADVGTTGEIRLFENGLHTASDVFTITDGFSNNLVWTWLHGYPPTMQDPRLMANTLFQPHIQARRTSGAGNIFVFYPTEFLLIGSQFCAATAGGRPAIRDH